jgi:hypothetical protein
VVARLLACAHTVLTVELMELPPPRNQTDPLEPSSSEPPSHPAPAEVRLPPELRAQLTPVPTSSGPRLRSRAARLVIFALLPALFVLVPVLLFGEAAAWVLLVTAILAPPALLAGWVGVAVVRARRS